MASKRATAAKPIGPDCPPQLRAGALADGTVRYKMGVAWEVRDRVWVRKSEAPSFYDHADYDQVAAKVRKAHAAAGFPIDENGIRRQLITLRALGLIDWKEGPPSAMMAPTFKS